MSARTRTVSLVTVSLALALGWSSREFAFARERADQVKSATINLDQVKMSEEKYEGKRSGDVGVYVKGDTPASTNFITGRFVIDPGKTPHKPHTHAEEEVMVI